MKTVYNQWPWPSLIIAGEVLQLFLPAVPSLLLLCCQLPHTERTRAVLKPNLCTQLPPPHVILYTAACPAELNKRESEKEETDQRASQTPAAPLSDASLTIERTDQYLGFIKSLRHSACIQVKKNRVTTKQQHIQDMVNMLLSLSALYSEHFAKKVANQTQGPRNYFIMLGKWRNSLEIQNQFFKLTYNTQNIYLI